MTIGATPPNGSDEPGEHVPGSLDRRRVLPLLAGTIGAGYFASPGEARASAAPAAGTLTDPASGVVLGPGVHTVRANTTLKVSLFLQPGARIDIAAGRRLRVLGDFVAPAEQVLQGSGELDLNASTSIFARPEWWGARSDGKTDCAPALAACLQAHRVMQLGCGDYAMARSLRVMRPFTRITGMGHRGTAQGEGTRLVVTNGDDDVLIVGPQTPPAQVNDFPQGIAIEGLTLARSAPAGANAAGLRAQFLLYGEFTDLAAFEHAISFACRGLVRSRLRNCIAFRSLPGSGPSRWRGFHLNGMDAIGLAGGNASLFIEDCNASIGGDPAVEDPVGLLADGAFADCFIAQFESSGVATGLRIAGMTRQIGTRADHGQANLHIRMPVLDQCARTGLDIVDCASSALIDLSEPYVALAPGGQCAISLRAMHGSLTIQGGQLLGGMDNAAGGDAIGLDAKDSDGLAIYGLRIQDMAHPVVFAACTRCDVRLQVCNPSHQARDAALLLSDCKHILAAPLVSGRKAAFSAGVVLQRAKGSHSVELAGIERASLAQRAHAIVIDGVPAVRDGRMNDITLSGS